MPAITPENRVGVVMGSGAEGISAGNFILSSVTAFYDHLRATKEEFFEYPNYYTFQTTSDPADYRMLDVYPNHKNVTVEADGERMLQAITDRAIDILLVPDNTTGEPDIEKVTRRSAERCIDHCYIYAGEGQLTDPDFSINMPLEPVRGWYETTLDSMDSGHQLTGQEWYAENEPGLSQDYKDVQLDEALASLPIQQ